MKKLAAGFLAITLIFSASLCWAAYVIHLKDGRNITTHEYWDEEDQIKIKQYGGVVGIAKDDVVSIEETDDVKTIVVKSPPETKLEGTKKGAETPQGREDKAGDVNKEKKSEKPNKESAQKEKNPLLKEFDALKKDFEGVESMSKQQLSQFDKALRALRNKIIKAGLASPYANQMVEILDMGSKAEEMFKKRGQ
jgi:hypothetical protein